MQQTGKSLPEKDGGMTKILRQSIQEWFRRYFSNQQVIILILLLAAGFILVYFFIGILMPVFAALIIAYVLDGVVKRLEDLPMGRLPAVLIVFSLFMAFLLAMLMVFLPLLYWEVAQLAQELPSMIMDLRGQIQVLSQRYPDVMSPGRIRQVQEIISSELTSIGEYLIQMSVSSVRSIITILIYVVLVPFVTFFLLKDKDMILSRLKGALPENSGLAVQVGKEANRQFSNYVRGKIWEILIEWGLTYIAFILLGLKYALLLSFFVGLSVLVPYIGVILAALPAILVGLVQWGIGAQIAYLLGIFIVIQTITSNIINPLLFSEMVNIHPVAIIVALLVFGELWGVWGLVFAIPLATLIQTVINAWIRTVSRRAVPEEKPGGR